MPGLGDLYGAHPAWIWAAGAAALLALEVASGSGWLLWPGASAGVVAVVEGFVRLPAGGAVLLFAALTIVSTATARRYIPARPPGEADDINDAVRRLIGHEGRVVAAFDAGVGRVLVEGKEWSAELDPGEAADVGARIQVTGVVGARLRIRSAPDPSRAD
jgi:membrane protein implicated in regulation of membrane protease activity